MTTEGKPAYVTSHMVSHNQIETFISPYSPPIKVIVIRQLECEVPLTVSL